MRITSMFHTFAAVMVVLTFSTPILPLAQQDSPTIEAAADAIADAERDINQTSWFAAGCFLNIIGLAAAQMHGPSVPADRLIGKSPEYIAVYAIKYKERLSKLQRDYALMGCVLGCVVLGAVAVFGGSQSGGSQSGGSQSGGGGSWCGFFF